MRRRPSRDNTPSGSRLRQRGSSPDLNGSRKRQKKSTSLPPPTRLYLCECFECTEHPDPDPRNGLPSVGRWITEKERKEHSARHKTRGVAQATLTTHLVAPQLEFSIPTSGIPIPALTSAPTAPAPPPAPETSLPTVPPSNPNDEISAYILLLGTPIEELFKDTSVIFQTPPDPTTQVDPSLLDPQEIEQLCTLDRSSMINTHIVGFQDILERVDNFLRAEKLKPLNSEARFRLRLELLTRDFEQKKNKLRALLLEQWKFQENVAKLHYSYDTAHLHIKAFLNMSPITLACFLLVATLYLISGVSMDQCSFILGSLQTILRLALESSVSVHGSSILRSIPNDVRTVIDILNTSPRFDSYVCCPRCSKLFMIDPKDPSSFPDTCTNAEADQDVCGAKLKKKRKMHSHSHPTPARKYLQQKMADYIGRLYSRPDLQDYLFRDPSSSPCPDETWDIWDAPYLRNFIGPDGKPFIKAPPNEGRLIFSLNMDGFNPYGNKQSGKKVSVGAIYMVCLNLPPSIRYDLENVYLVGVIPGPSQPSQHEINYLLKPLVDELVRLWEDGVYLSRTCKYPHGLRVRCALGPLVCDLPAARQMSGFAHFGSTNFCSECTQTLQDIQDLDYKKWNARDASKQRQAAFAWRNATTQQEREELMQENGIRWSELFRLDYWDPTKLTVIDSMHAFFLRLFQHHCRSIWGMDVNFEDGDGIAFESSRAPSEAEMLSAQYILRNGQKTQLSSLRTPVIRQLCHNTSTLDSSRRKGDLVKQLIQYRIRQGWFNASGDLLGSRVGARNESAFLNEALQGTEHEFSKKNVLQTMHDVEDYFRNASKTALYRLRRSDLFALYLHRIRRDINLSEEAIKELKAMQNKELLLCIQNRRMEEGIVDKNGRLLTATQPKTRVLGRGILAEIREDMAHTSLPSWMATAPAHPGEKKWGKFSADQWRAFCTQVLPVTLIRLWGHMDENSVERRRLDNFLHLVSAVKLATMRKMTKPRIVSYMAEMHSYLTSLVELYPDVKITPYQHMALHFDRYLERFGPTHAWRCFPFERYNYVMQNIPTNQKFGDLEQTMFHKFIGAQSLRTLFKPGNIPGILNPLIDLYGKIFKSDIRGTYRNDVMFYDDDFRKLSESVTWTEDQLLGISQDTYSLLKAFIAKNYNAQEGQIPRKAFFRESISRLGQTFSTKKHSQSDCHVIFTKSDDSPWSAASIIEIFSQARQKDDGSEIVQTFALLKEYQQLSAEDSKMDHYQRYQFAGGRLFQRKYNKNPILVDFSRIEAHFAAYRCKISPTMEWLLALPLDKA